MKKLLEFVTGSFIVGIVLSFGSVLAVTGADFDPARIIDDSVFYDPNTMTVQEIDDFLWDMLDDSDQIPDGVSGSCDNNGVELYGSQTRASFAEYKYNNLNAYGIYSGTKVPFVCLAEYYENTSTGENNYWSYDESTEHYENETAGGIPNGAISSAQIIYNVAQTHGINPQVLLVLLQKEQNLVIDDWPWGIQYQKATGYGCPDTAPCNSEYYGFFNQLNRAANQFNLYKDNPNNYGHIAGQLNSVRFSPTASCGSTNVFIVNQATAGLYNYTPYQPNAAALANLYGGGDSCSAYGNRNFWRYFNDWFGSTYGTTDVTGKLVVKSNGGFVTSNGLTAEFEVTNRTIDPETIDKLVVAARDPDGNNVNFSTVYDIALNPGESYVYSQTRSFSSPGEYTFWIASYTDGEGWSKTWPESANNSIIRDRSLDISLPETSISGGLNFTPQPVIGVDTTAEFEVTNDDSVAITIDKLVVAARDPDGNNVNFSTVYDIALNPGESYVYSQTRSFSSPGEYTFWVSAYVPGVGWRTTWPSWQNSNDVRLETDVELVNVNVSSGLNFTPQPVIGVDTTAEFEVTNDDSVAITIDKLVVAARDPDGNNVNFSTVYDIALNPGESYVYSQTRSFSSPGEYTFWIASYTDGEGWSKTWPESATGTITRTISNIGFADVYVSSRLKFNDGIDVDTDTVGTFTIKNNESFAVAIDKLVVAARDPDGNNVNFSTVYDITINPGEKYTYSQTRQFPAVGEHNLWIASYIDGEGWQKYWPTPSSSNPILTVNVN